MCYYLNLIVVCIFNSIIMLIRVLCLCSRWTIASNKVEKSSECQFFVFDHYVIAFRFTKANQGHFALFRALQLVSLERELQIHIAL